MKQGDKGLYLGLQLLMYILGKLSLRAGVLLGNFLGGIWFYIDKRHKKIAIDNLSHAYKGDMTHRQIRTLARKVFDNTARMVIEYAWFYSSGSKYKSGAFTIKGIEHLRAAYEKKKGVLILTAHLGNWEFGAALAPLTGLPITVVYQKIKLKPVDQLIKINRESLGIKLFKLHNAFDGVSQALEQGDLIGLLVDQNARRRGVFIDFFGRKTSANPGLSKLALQTGSPVIPAFTYREKGKFVIEIQPELSLIKTGNNKNDILINTQIQNTAIEKIIRRYPEQWFWIHRRWKTRPLEEKQRVKKDLPAIKPDNHDRPNRT